MRHLVKSCVHVKIGYDIVKSHVPSNKFTSKTVVQIFNWLRWRFNARSVRHIEIFDTFAVHEKSYVIHSNLLNVFCIDHSILFNIRKRIIPTYKSVSILRSAWLDQFCRTWSNCISAIIDFASHAFVVAEIECYVKFLNIFLKFGVNGCVLSNIIEISFPTGKYVIIFFGRRFLRFCKQISVGVFAVSNAICVDQLAVNKIIKFEKPILARIYGCRKKISLSQIVGIAIPFVKSICIFIVVGTFGGAQTCNIFC